MPKVKTSKKKPAKRRKATTTLADVTLNATQTYQSTDDIASTNFGQVTTNAGAIYHNTEIPYDSATSSVVPTFSPTDGASLKTFTLTPPPVPIVAEIASPIEEIRHPSHKTRKRKLTKRQASEILLSKHLIYELRAFPKIRHLNKQMMNLKESLQPLLRVIKCSVKDEIMKQFEEITKPNLKDDGVQGHMPMQTDSIFLLQDLQINKEIGELNVHVLGTESQINEAVTLISPNISPKHNYECHEDEILGIKLRGSGISSRLYGSLEVYVCWLPPVSDLENDTKIYRILRNLDKQSQIIYLTEDEDISKVKNTLNRVFPGLTNDVVVQNEKRDSIRKHISDALCDKVFDRLEIVKKLLLACKDNVIMFPDSEFNGCKTLQLAILQADLKHFDECFTHGTDLSFFDRKCFCLSDVLERKLFHVNTLLREKSNSSTKQDYRSIPEKMIYQLKGLKSRGVTAFGVWLKEFRVYIDTSTQQEDELQLLETDIRNIVQCHFKEINIVRSSGPLLIKYISKGDKLIPDENKPQSYGTLGVFAKDKSEHLIGVTSGHVAIPGSKLFIEMAGRSECLGTCHISTMGKEQHAADLSLIKINEKMYPNCRIEFLSEEGKILRPEVYTGPPSGLVAKLVHKKGATTDWTVGGIAGEHIDLDEPGPFLVVKSHAEKQFSKPGDSGSVVFMYDENDVELSTIYLLSMVTGGMVTGGEKAVTGQYETLTSMLEPEIQKLPDINLTFDLSQDKN